MRRTISKKHDVEAAASLIEKLEEPSPVEVAWEARIRAAWDELERTRVERAVIMQKLRDENPEAFARMDELAAVGETAQRTAIADTLALSRALTERVTDARLAVMRAYPSHVQEAIYALLRRRQGVRKASK